MDENIAENIAANDLVASKGNKKGFSFPKLGAKKIARAPHENVRKKAHDKIILSQVMGIAAGWLLAIGIIWIGLFYAAQNRNAIVQKWPKSASAFAFFGVPANLYGLEINSIMVRAGSDINGPRIIVSGVVQSVSKEGKQVPYLRVTLIDEKGAKKDSWMVDPQAIYLAPNAYQAFASLRRNPPIGNLRAIVTFAEPPPKANSLNAHSKAPIATNNAHGENNAALAGGDNSHAAPSQNDAQQSTVTGHDAGNDTGHADVHTPTTALGR